MRTPLQKAGIAVFGVVLVLMVFTLGQSYMMIPEEQVAAYQMLDELKQK
ncbi:MAG TPA: hypothetical protein VKP65_08615 [Rhodothermales bacterium]|nr:hypothetical protein [Rhodothermales bacterium]